MKGEGGICREKGEGGVCREKGQHSTPAFSYKASPSVQVLIPIKDRVRKGSFSLGKFSLEVKKKSKASNSI